MHTDCNKSCYDKIDLVAHLDSGDGENRYVILHEFGHHTWASISLDNVSYR